MTLYGARGDVCATPGCHTILRRTNQWNICAKCQDQGRPATARLPENRIAQKGPAAAGQGPRADSTPPSAPRHSQLGQALLERLKAAAGRPVSRDELALALNASSRALGQLMRRLAVAGEPVEIVYADNSHRTPSYRYVAVSAAGASSAPHAPEVGDAARASSGSPDAPGEQPAQPAADLAHPHQGPSPAAGAHPDPDMVAISEAIALIELRATPLRRHQVAAAVAAWFAAARGERA